MRFEFDPSEVGRKQGEALDEPRYQVIGRIGERTWSAFVTYRKETIRIISVRRARPEEEARYLAD